MILDLDNILVYLPSTDGFDSIMQNYKMMEERAFLSLLMSSRDKWNTWIIIGAADLLYYPYRLRRVIADFHFEYVEKEIGSGYWIKEFEKGA